MGWSPSHGRIKPKYNRFPNAAERRLEAMLYGEPCFGCGGRCTELHHTLLEFDGKQFRRDHRFQLPLCGLCHRGDCGIHGFGSEIVWLDYVGRTENETIAYMRGNWAKIERKAA